METLRDKPTNSEAWESIRGLRSKDPAARHESAEALASLTSVPVCATRRFDHACYEPWRGYTGSRLLAALLPFTAAPVIYESRSIIFMEGAASTGVWLLCAGTARLTRSSPTGKNVTLCIAHPGAVLGLSAIIARDLLRMAAQTAGRCGLAFIEREHLFRLMSDQHMADLVTEALGRELQATYSSIGDLMLARSARGRVARVLLSEFKGDEMCSHQHLAELASCSRETVTRLMGRMQRAGLIAYVNGCLRLLDRAGIEAICP